MDFTFVNVIFAVPDSHLREFYSQQCTHSITHEKEKKKYNVTQYKSVCNNKKAVLPQGNRAMPQVFFSVEVRQQHSLQI